MKKWPLGCTVTVQSVDAMPNDLVDGVDEVIHVGRQIYPGLVKGCPSSTT